MAPRADDPTAEVLTLFVIPARRGERIGERLMDACLAWARERGAERVSVAAFASNAGAIRFYERNGFTPHEITLERPLSADGG